MNIGVSAFAWTTHFTEKHVEILPTLRDHGLTHFEIAMFDPASIPVSALRRAFESNELIVSVCAILPGGINPISEDASIREASIGHLRRCIETTAELGAGLLCGPVYAPIGYLPGRRRNQQEWGWAVEAVQAVTPQLEACEVTLAIEPVNRSETFFLNTAAEASEFCKAVDHPRLGVTIDTFHANIEEKNIAGAITSLGSRLKHLHVSENDRGLAGSGHVNFPEIVRSLKDIHYEGVSMLEGFGYSADEPNSLGALWGDPQVSPEDIAFQGASYLREVCLRA
jgi:D-psicose/D-tagatose/L-ribulose 3-epimerase